MIPWNQLIVLTETSSYAARLDGRMKKDTNFNFSVFILNLLEHKDPDIIIPLYVSRKIMWFACICAYTWKGFQPTRLVGPSQFSVYPFMQLEI